ncbi:hypothetical protein Tsubulata_029673 [Turnera subulata]|uniref:F-box domain-containing protein n=1 Tax=Turnera subulata TaxID=218843 RepID=A0A9Q0JCX6_9ROSI|nr:hypothetical protein Tsubulata_029673 [Turnera subulata]
MSTNHPVLITCAKEEEKEETWSNLEIGVLSMVMERLPFVDNLQFAAVCKHWHYASKTCLRKEYSQSTKHRLPWLMEIQPSKRQVINMVNNKKYSIECPPEFFPRASKKGWLLLSLSCQISSHLIFLLNPLTKNQIELPKWSLPPFDAAISVKDGIPNCVAIARAPGIPSPLTLQIICPTNQDKDWKRYEYNISRDYPIASLAHLLIIDQDVYMSDRCGHVLRFNMVSSTFSEVVGLKNDEVGDINQYTLEMEGELVKIIPRYTSTTTTTPRLAHFLFYKLNQDRTEWIKLEVHELKGTSWFLQDYSQQMSSFVVKGTPKTEIFRLHMVFSLQDPKLVLRLDTYNLDILNGCGELISTREVDHPNCWVDLG